MKEGNEVTTPRKKTQTDTPRLPRAERERLIVEGAVQFFAEVGCGGDTRELAKRLNITHPVIFRYFARKKALIERGYQEVFIGRRNRTWREDERRGGKEGGRTCRYRGTEFPKKTT